MPSHHIDLSYPRLCGGEHRNSTLLLFSIFDEGRRSQGTARKVNKLLDRINEESEGWYFDPITVLHDWWERDVLNIPLKECGLGKLSMLEGNINDLIRISLNDASEEELLTLPGIGPKTVEFFIQNRY